MDRAKTSTIDSKTADRFDDQGNLVPRIGSAVIGRANRKAGHVQAIDERGITYVTAEGTEYTEPAESIRVLPDMPGVAAERFGYASGRLAPSANMEGDGLANLDPTHGVPVRIGAMVVGDQTQGYVTAMTPGLCIFVDEDGVEHASRWGATLVQAAFPDVSSTGREPDRSAAAGEPAAGAGADPFYRAALDVQRTLNRVEHLIASIAADATALLHDEAVETLELLSARKDGPVQVLLEASRQSLDKWSDPALWGRLRQQIDDDTSAAMTTHNADRAPEGKRS